MKIHFALTVLFAAFVAVLAMSQDLKTRMLLTVPVMVLYFTAMLTMIVEYDRQEMKNWEIKKRKLIEDTYVRFFKEKKHSIDG